MIVHPKMKIHSISAQSHWPEWFLQSVHRRLRETRSCFHHDPLFAFPNRLLDPCNTFQDASARTILTSLHWLPVSYRTDIIVQLLVYKSRNGLGPKYISEEYKPSRPLRSVGSSQLEVPWVKTKHCVGLNYCAAHRMNQLS